MFGLRPRCVTMANNCKCDLLLPEVPFQQFYSFVTVKLLCCNDLKFWLVCEGALSFGKAIIGLQLLFRAIYYDFLAWKGYLELRKPPTFRDFRLQKCIYDLVITNCEKNHQSQSGVKYCRSDVSYDQAQGEFTICVDPFYTHVTHTLQKQNNYKQYDLAYYKLS